MNERNESIERDTDRIEIIESRRAVDAAKASSAEADELLSSLHQTSKEIRSIVQENGYLTRFRTMLRGA